MGAVGATIGAARSAVTPRVVSAAEVGGVNPQDVVDGKVKINL
jgi:hypothetical protein